MPDRIYQGAHAAVEIIVDGAPVIVTKGEKVTVSDAQSKEMDVSDAWGKPGSKSKEEE